MTKTSTLILHIGHYKTGTTALQNFFVKNFERLTAQGLVYAEEPVHNFKHSALAFSLLHEAGVTKLMYGFKDRSTARDRWQRLFDATRALPDGQAMLVSSEEFIRIGAYPAAIEALRAQIDTARDLRFRVIAYLRPPHDHLSSWYNQLVKTGVEDAGFDAATLSRTEAVHWDYGLALRPWVDIFGPDAVLVRPFERSLRNGDRIYHDFLDALGYTVPTQTGAVVEDPNPRLDDRLLALRRGAARAGVKQSVPKEMIEEAARGLQAEDGGEAPRRRFDALRAEAAAGIKAVAALPGSSLDADHMLADLPRAQDPLERRLDEVVSVLTSELVRLRARVMRQAARITELEGGPRHAPSAAGEGDDVS